MKPSSCKKCGGELEKYYFKSHKKIAAYWFIYGWRCSSCGNIFNDEDAKTAIRPISEKERSDSEKESLLKKYDSFDEIVKINQEFGFTKYSEYI